VILRSSDPNGEYSMIEMIEQVVNLVMLISIYSRGRSTRASGGYKYQASSFPILDLMRCLFALPIPRWYNADVISQAGIDSGESSIRI
jgi:hypothetical protein